MKSNLRNCKVGDTILVKAEVIEIHKNSDYPILTNVGLGYSFDGKYDKADKFPSAFLECPFVEVKEYEVTDADNFYGLTRKGVVVNEKLYVESHWDNFKEVEQKVTLEIPLSELENNPDLKKYLKQ